MITDSVAFDEWLSLQREHFMQRVLSASDRLMQWLEWRGRYSEAIAYGRRQVEMEPLLEESHRQLMRLLALNGETAAAIAQFNQLKRILARELAAEPEAATAALMEAIRSGDIGHWRRPRAGSTSPWPQRGWWAGREIWRPSWPGWGLTAYACCL